MTAKQGSFTLHVAKEFLSFSAAHFIAHKDSRELLHGHNYRLAVTVEGTLGPNGYVIDFGLVKQAARRLCNELDSRTLIPTRSDTLSVVERGQAVEITCDDGSHFVLPRTDVVMLPIVHSSVEELSRYLCERLSEELRSCASGDITAVEVSVAEGPGQDASYRLFP
jgi:6-pyruvoyltetrahydropterin/6-carboxytetrahydropterin synthase